MKSAIIIGSGIAGLAASIRLAKQGYKVAVHEANNYPGGKVHSFELGSYRFDGGPSLFTMPQFIEELFEITGKQITDYFNYNQSDIACNYFWEDGIAVSGFSDSKAFSKEVEQKLNVQSSIVDEYFAHIKNIYDHSGKIFLEKSLHRAETWFQKETLLSLLKIHQFDLTKTMHRANQIRLGEPHLVQLFDRFATYNGSNPYKAPGILNVIPWLEHGFGTFFPKGGMIQIPNALYQLALDLGVTFHFNSRAEEIILTNNRAIGIKTQKQEFKADIVISNMDVFYTYRKLLPKSKAPERILNQERSSSALVFYWGIKGKFPALDLHNIFFSRDYKTEFEDLFEKGVIHDDPTVYVNISSKKESTDAPEGCENWFVMVNAPNHKGQDWQAIIQSTRESVLKKLSQILKKNIGELIEEERIWTPEQIESDTLSYQGALYGNSSNSQLAAFLRHPNFSNKIKNLFFCGGSVHPGGGIPLALLSAKITSDSIQKRAK